MTLNILITNSKSGAFYYIATSWINALKAAGHNAMLWNGDQSTWNKVDPDIYIGCSGWRQNFRKGPKVAIHVNPYCDEIIRNSGPVINESQDAINWTMAQKPDLVFGYGLEKHIKKYWNKWTNHGLKVIGMPNAADTVRYYPVPKDNKYAVDIGWVGGYWKYKAVNLDKYIVPVARRFKSRWYGWSGPQGLWNGKVNDEEIVRKLFSSARICPTVVEPHTTTYGIDMPERIFKVAACGGLVISDPVDDMDDYFAPGTVITTKNGPDYMTKCAEWISKSDNERAEQAKKLTREVLTKHTYFHRVQHLLRNLGFNDEASDMQKHIDLLESRI